jgi:beta-phosphoglucomutase
MIRGAIFDMDGVLVDNVEYHLRAWKQLGREQGKELKREDVIKVFGQRNREMIVALMGRPFTAEELTRCALRKEELYRSFMLPELKPVAGLPELLADLKRSAFKTAVATSGPKANVEMVLAGLRIEDCFDAVVTGADVKNSKPHPEIFLLATGKIGLPPEDCVVFEDSSSGILAARNAGCYCIGLATTHPPEDLQAYRPDKVVNDFRGLTAVALQEAWEARA